MDIEEKKMDETRTLIKESPRPFDWNREDVVVFEDDGGDY